MASLKALKLRIGSVKSTQKITKALNMVAAAKLRRAQQSAMAGRPYSERMSEVVASLARSVTPGPQSPKLLAGTGKDDTHLIVVATGDRGLAGAFNTNIGRAARKKAVELEAQGKKVLFYFVGRKGRPPFQRSHAKSIIGQHDTMAMKNPTYSEAVLIANDILDRFESGQFDVAHLAYSTFKSVLVQEPTLDQIIPVAKPRLTKVQEMSAALARQILAAPIEDLVIEYQNEGSSRQDAERKATERRREAEGALARLGLASGSSTAAAAIEYEPDEEEILAALLPKNIAIQIYRAMLENAAGFYGSQMTAMDNATRNAGDMISKLSIKYNRQRQAAITTELVEIISGAEAL